MTRTFRVVVLSLGLYAGGADGLSATPQAAGEKATSVDVGFDMGKAGDTASLPIQLNAPDGVRVGATINDVTFPTKWFTFAEVRPSPAADADVKADLKDDGKNAGNAIVRITVTARQGVTLPNGIIASVVFKIAADAKEPQVVKLKNAARALGTSSADVPPAPIEPVTGRDGEIELLASVPAVVACFFYMH